MSKNYYEILGVPSNAIEQEIKMAYHKLARRYHPDKAPAGTDAAALEAEFSLISTAYNVLKDREKRTAYDQSLEVKRQHELNRTGVGSSIEDTNSGTQKPGASGPSISDKNRAAVARRAYLKGVQLFSLGDYSKASEFFEIAIKNNDAEAGYHAKLALTLLRAHRSFSRATEAAQKAIQVDPYNSDYRVLLAELYESAGITTMAVKTYQDILVWDATNERALQALKVLSPRKESFLKKLFGKKS